MGAWASRPIARSAGIAVCVLAGGAVAAIVFGLTSSPAPFVVPPLMPVARAIADGTITGIDVLWFTGWALLWSFLVLAGYWSVRRRRV